MASPIGLSNQNQRRMRLAKWLLLLCTLIVVSAFIRFRVSVQQVLVSPTTTGASSSMRDPVDVTIKPHDHHKQPQSKQKHHHHSQHHHHEDSEDAAAAAAETQHQSQASNPTLVPETNHKEPTTPTTTSSLDEASQVETTTTTTATTASSSTSQSSTNGGPEHKQHKDKKKRSKDNRSSSHSKHNNGSSDTKQRMRDRIKENGNDSTRTINSNNHTIADTSSSTSPTPLFYIPPYLDKQRAAAFVNASCILQNTPWFPTSTASGSTASSDSDTYNGTVNDNDDSWQLRAPKFMILGARDSGTRLLASHLMQHSQVVSNSRTTTTTATSSQEVAYFTSFRRQRQRLPATAQSVAAYGAGGIASSNSSTFNTTTSTSTATTAVFPKIHVWRARQQLYAKWYPSKLLKKNASLIAMDETPDYLFYSDDCCVPRAILCTSPWIQLVVVLRNPVERTFASYRHARRYLGWRGSFAQYVDLDMQTMEKAGLIGLSSQHLQQQQQQSSQNGTRINTTHDHGQEDAWRLYLQYTNGKGDSGPVGRSLYHFQLQEWFSVLEEMGRRPPLSSSVHIICYHAYKANPRKEYHKVLDFLGLPNEDDELVLPPPSTLSIMSTANKEDEITIKRLQRFFRPYNRRLYKLLGNDGWHANSCWSDNG